MKKVGIITLHRVVNYGSVLQTYALQTKLKELGYESEVIDYYPERLHKLGMLKRIKDKGDIFKKNIFVRNMARAVIFPSYIIRFNMFTKFLKKYIKMTSKTYYTEKDFMSDDFDYDIFCTGSDQVWNSGWNEKIETPYFLKFAPDDKPKIAYAASFGKKKLDANEVAETRELLDRYDSISLREQSGVDIVESLGISGSVCVVDPTLLLNGDEWRKLSSKKYKGEKYILVYNLNRNKKIDTYAKNLANKTGLKIKVLSYQLHEVFKSGQVICNPKVEDFLSLIDNAQFVITDSFHATAFSINFNTQFVIVFPEKFSTRLQSLLNLNHLENRVAKDENDLKIVEDFIDFDFVNATMQKEREKSYNWLKNALEKGKKL